MNAYEVKEYPSNRKVASVSEIRKKIDGAMGGISVVALLVAFIK